MNNWSPLIMARTKNADFKWHVRPSDFQEEQMRWVKKYIIPIMPGTGNSMPVTPVISAFSNGIYTCVGIVCLAKDLASDIQFTVDKFSRMCFAFVGFVTNEPFKELPSIFLYSEKQTIDYDLSIYRKLYIEYVEAVWEKDPYDLELNWLRRNNYSHALQTQLPVINETEYSDITEKYNTNGDYLQVFMPSDSQSRLNDYMLLQAFIKDKAVYKSICLNALDRDSIIAGPYKNATINTAIKNERIVRVPPKPVEPPPVDYSVGEQKDTKKSKKGEVNSCKTGQKEYKGNKNSIGQHYDSKGKIVMPVDNWCPEVEMKKKQENGWRLNLFGKNEKHSTKPNENNDDKPKRKRNIIGLPKGKKLH